MKWSWKLGRWAGTEVRVHFTFLLLLAWVALGHLATGGIAAAVAGTVFVVLVFGCVLLHEFGHALAARMFGIRTPDITLLPIGGVARLERMPRNPVQELIVAVAGPAVNVVIAAVLILLLGLGGLAGGLDQLASPGTALLAKLATVNLWLVLFNLIPAFPMDGGRVLRALLAMFSDYERATRVAAGLGKVLAIGFGVVGLFGNPMLALIGVFIYLAAAAELKAVEMSRPGRPGFVWPAPDPEPGEDAMKAYDEDGRFVGWVNPPRSPARVIRLWR